MPTITVYEQTRKRWNLDTGELVGRERRASFAPIPGDGRYRQDGAYMRSTGRTRRPFPDVPRLDHIVMPVAVETPCEYGVEWSGGSVPIRVKVPIDARFEPRNAPCVGVVLWPGSPLTCKQVASITTLDAARVLEIARKRLTSVSGDTFTFVEETIAHASDGIEIAAPGVCGHQSGDGPDQEVLPRASEPYRHDAPGRADRAAFIGVDREVNAQLPVEHASASVAGEHDGERPGAESDCPARRVDRGDSRLPSVIIPANARWVGGDDAPTLEIGEPGARVSIAAVCIPTLARLGRFGLRLAELGGDLGGPEVIPNEPQAIPARGQYLDPYTSERVPARGASQRRAKDAVGQALMF